MAVDPIIIQQHLLADLNAAKAIVAAANIKWLNGPDQPIDLTLNTPRSVTEELQRLCDEQQAGLQETMQSPFFLKVLSDIEDSYDGSTEQVTYYISRAPQRARLDLPAQVELISWASPIALNLEKERLALGKKFTISVAKYTGTHTIRGTGKFGSVFPKMRDVVYLLEHGTARVAELDAFLKSVVPVAPPPREIAEKVPVQARDRASKRDIIELKSRDQVSALLLPFDHNVLIGGPPGSGKTTIGVMRIRCLIESQAEVLDLDLSRGEHRFKPEWTRILVLSEQMVANLEDLVKDLYLQRVRLETFRDFFRVIARECKTLSHARDRDESPAVMHLKGLPRTLNVVFEAFQQHVREYMKGKAPAIRGSLLGDVMAIAARNAVRLELEPVFTDVMEVLEALARAPSEADDSETKERFSTRLQDAVRALVDEDVTGKSARWKTLRQQAAAMADSLWLEFENWAKAVSGASIDESQKVSGDINLGRRLAVWAQKHVTRVEQLSQEAQRTPRLFLAAAEDVAERLASKMIPSVTRLTAIPTTPAYAKLLEDGIRTGLSQEHVAKAKEAWQAQLERGGQTYSEQDTVMAVWLGSHVAMVPDDGRRRVIGHGKAKLTHILVDEAQDVSPIHGITLNRLLDENGTISVAGDLHQRVTEGRGLRSWDELGIPLPAEALFPVNERQSRVLGEFVLRLHEVLFGNRPEWRASNGPGSKPRIRVAPEISDFLAAVTEEIQQIRRTIPRATVGVIYDDSDNMLDDEQLEQLHEYLESRLPEEDVVPVHTIKGADETRAINLVDCVKIMSVVRAKGLEFDGVVLIGQGSRWDRDIDSYGDICRNRLYVAVSRPTASLSIVTRSRPGALDPLLKEKLCEMVTEG